jgi:16S rRNA G966 N2-methylase RsmD
LNLSILHKEVQHFINENLDKDTSKLLFKGSPFDDIPIQAIVEQIESKKRTQKKLSTWFSTKNIYYPNKLNIEQTSSEITAKYKSNLISGNSIIDLTGGFGVDTYYFSKRFKNVTHCEINTELSQIVTHNYKQLLADNIKTIFQDGVEFLNSKKEYFDWIYVDPSRRNELKDKVFLLEDCLPNVPKNLDSLFKYSNNILVKASPMLDITSAINELNFVKEVHIVAVENEVKELLFILNKSHEEDISIKTVNLTRNHNQYFEAQFKSLTIVDLSLPQTYLYEPNASILKASLFDSITKLGVSKLHQNSHLYTSDQLIDFPGRRFIIKDVISYNKKQLKKLIPSQKANITTRNFPETVAQIRKKTGIKDGGSIYIFFTTNLNNKHVVIICEKV